MFKFPKDLYTDVRMETVYSTAILFENGKLTQNKTKCEKGAFIRVYDGERWYYLSTTDLDNLQVEMDNLAKMAKPNMAISQNPVVKKFEVNKGEFMRFEEQALYKVSNEEKIALLESYLPVFDEFPEIKQSKAYYVDNYTKKHILSSLGTDVTFDTQNACVALRATMQIKDLPEYVREDVFGLSISELEGKQDQMRESCEKTRSYGENAVPVVPGVYTCVLSPVTAGVFAHESFGHKSESDFMVGDETMKKEWALGTKVGSEILNILESGTIDGSGYVPFDDEGTRAKENHIIRDGILTGRLHSAYTAAALEEDLTGNARALNFEFEPIVRMTTTYIGAGKYTKDGLISEIGEGIYIEDFKHGSGMSTFTIAPLRVYMIRNGKIAEPVKVSVITGNVMETLGEIDGLSDTVELKSFALGGCGKMEQYPLRVGFGGPYVRVRGINVQ